MRKIIRWFPNAKMPNRICVVTFVFLVILAVSVCSFAAGSVIPDRFVSAKRSTHIRNKPSFEGKILGVLTQGETAPYLEEHDSDERGVIWYRINHKNGTGWVSSTHLTLDAAESTENAGTTNYAVQAADLAYIRGSSNHDGIILGIIFDGMAVPYLGDYEMDERRVVWHKVLHNDDTGWVSSMHSEIVLLDGMAPDVITILDDTAWSEATH